MTIRKPKRKTVYHVLSVALILASVLLSALRFAPIAGRVVQSVKDLGLSIAFYFTEMFGFEGVITPSVTAIPKGIASVLPVEPSEFAAKMKVFGKLLIDKVNAQLYFVRLGRIVASAAKILLIAVLPVLLLGVVVSISYRNENNDYNEDTRALRVWRRIEEATYYPVKRFVTDYIDFIKSDGKYLKLLLAIWLYNLNLITIAVEVLAYVFYFPFAIPKFKLYTQMAKLAIDVTVPLSALPLWADVLLGWLVFDHIRKGIGLQKLDAGEAKNRTFLESNPGALLVTGKQRAKKTTIITDMALSQAAIFREKAKEKLQARDLQFPFFPWINLELSVQYGIEAGHLPTLAHVREYIRYLKRAFHESEGWPNGMRNRALKNLLEKYGYDFKRYLFPSGEAGYNRRMFYKAYRHSPREFVFGYDFERYGLTYNDNLGEVDIFEALEKYAQLYWIYTAPTLNLANYAIRTDTLRLDKGNFPLFNDDFFRRDPREQILEYCRILDFDAMRLGKIMDERDPHKDGLEIGVVNVMEMAKERGNQHTKNGTKNSPECNQCNDLFELDVKMHGHAATVDNYTFFRLLLDDQRADSLGADNRDLCDTLTIKKVSDAKIVMPFFAIEEAAYLLATKLFNKVYYTLRHLRGDNTLLVYLLKKIYAPIYNHYTRIFNQYSSYTATVRIANEMTNEVISDKGKYYISTKKVYSYRFATDAINEFYHKKALRSNKGLNDFSRYKDLHPSCEEMKEIRGHFYKQLFDVFDMDDKALEKYRETAGVKYVWKSRDIDDISRRRQG